MPQLGEGIEYNSYVPIYDSMKVLNYKRYLSTLHEWVGGVKEIQIVPEISGLKQAVGWGGSKPIETCLLSMQYFNSEGFPNKLDPIWHPGLCSFSSLALAQI